MKILLAMAEARSKLVATRVLCNQPPSVAQCVLVAVDVIRDDGTLGLDTPPTRREANL